MRLEKCGKNNMSKSNKVSGVYQITNTENDLIYISSSKDIYKRWSAHIKELNKGTHINRFLQKIGMNMEKISLNLKYWNNVKKIKDMS